MMDGKDEALQACLQALEKGGVVLVPTEYGWCAGCDATNEHAVTFLRSVMCRQEGLLPVLLTEERDVLQWVAAADLAVFDFVAIQNKPTAIVFENGLGFAPGTLDGDGAVLILLTQHSFCRHLVKRFRRPLIAVPCSFEVFKQMEATGIACCNLHQEGKSADVFLAPDAALQRVHWNKGQPILQDF